MNTHPKKKPQGKTPMHNTYTKKIFLVIYVPTPVESVPPPKTNSQSL